MLQIFLLGFLVYLTILAPALLHTNQVEFIIERFTNVDVLSASYFDTVLYLSYLIVGILTAILSNKVGKRRIFILVGALGGTLSYFLLTVQTDYFLLLIVRFIQGSFTVLLWQTLMTMTLDNSNASNRGKNMGVFGIFLVLSMGSGPVLGGILAEQNVFVPYYTASILSGFVFLLSFFMLKEPQKIIPKPSLQENINIAKNKPRLIVPAIFNFVDRLHMGFILFLLPILLQELGFRPELRGMVLGFFALPYIILQYPIGKWSDKIGRYKPLILGSIFTGIVLSSIGFLSNYGLFVIIISFIVLGIGNGITGPPAMALVGDLIEKDENALGMGFFNLFGNLGIIIGPILGGFLANYTDFVTTFIVAGLIELIALTSAVSIMIIVFKEIPWLIKPIKDSEQIPIQ